MRSPVPAAALAFLSVFTCATVLVAQPPAVDPAQLAANTLTPGEKAAGWRLARAKRGHIAIQDHGDWVSYRNIKIRAL